jgi:ribosome maturation factor RimP
MSDQLHDVLSPLLAAQGIDLVDVEMGPALVRVTVDRAGGIDLDGLAAANRAVSVALDEIDPLPGRYTLEVSSPGLERRLRTPEQFARAVGQTVSVRTLPSTGAVRRVQGTLAAADTDGFELVGSEVPGGTMRIAFDEVERARTVFAWGSGPAPSPSRRPPKQRETPGAGHSRAPRARQDATGRVTTP